MTKFGKILVFLDLGLSLLLMTWAINFYLARIDWTDTAAKGDQPAGELVARKAKIDSLWTALTAPTPSANSPERSFRDARLEIGFQEVRRRETRKWYDVEMGLMDKAPPDTQMR